MPIYEYQCQKCGYKFDKIQKVTDAVLHECPECHEPALKKLVSAPSFKLTGTGWYETDFKNKQTKPDAKTPDAAAAKPEAKTEIKEASKTEPTAAVEKPNKLPSGAADNS